MKKQRNYERPMETCERNLILKTARGLQKMGDSRHLTKSALRI